MATEKQHPAPETWAAAPGSVLVRVEFVERMTIELLANCQKGDWTAWKPDRETIRGEIAHHYLKLHDAMKRGDRRRVSEYAADVANLAMKADEVFGAPNGCKLSDACWRGRTWQTEPALTPESVRSSAGLGEADAVGADSEARAKDAAAPASRAMLNLPPNAHGTQPPAARAKDGHPAGGMMGAAGRRACGRCGRVRQRQRWSQGKRPFGMACGTNVK